jgi:hypothetical protein
VEKTREVFRGVVDYIRDQRAKTSSLRPWLYPSAMLPVSIVGDGNARVAQEGVGYDLATMELVSPPQPKDIHYPFLFAIGNELDRAALTLEEKEEELEARYSKLNKNVLNKLLRGRTIKQVRQERQALAETLKVLEPKIREVTSTANKKMKSLI